MTLKITWFGTACFIAHLDEVNILFDPFFLRNEQAEPSIKTKPENLDTLDAIFITHAHFDHITEAGWFAENLNVPVYCSETTKKNIIKWVNGEIIEDYSHEFSERAENNIHIINNSDSIQVSENVYVDPIKSCHIKFDANTILSRLFSWKFIKKLRTVSAYGRGFPLGKVFGYNIKYNNHNILTFGSLCTENLEELEKYVNCDVLLIPYAGNSKKHLTEKTLKLVELLSPKVLIPHHWDDFFPPISRTEDLSPLLKAMERNVPEVNVKILHFEEKQEIIS
ncbi:MAG: MBL fold metallo-hydrolase [Promethearchaeota archaeon]|nr:MAG: MBL fold metallo-hydrolase [Candidatus Lokiarchaeota archaeon]